MRNHATRMVRRVAWCVKRAKTQSAALRGERRKPESPARRYFLPFFLPFFFSGSFSFLPMVCLLPDAATRGTPDGRSTSISRSSAGLPATLRSGAYLAHHSAFLWARKPQRAVRQLVLLRSVVYCAGNGAALAGRA